MKANTARIILSAVCCLCAVLHVQDRYTANTDKAKPTMLAMVTHIIHTNAPPLAILLLVPDDSPSCPSPCSTLPRSENASTVDDDVVIGGARPDLLRSATKSMSNRFVHADHYTSVISFFFMLRTLPTTRTTSESFYHP